MELLCKWCGEYKPEDQFVKRVRNLPYSQSNVRNCRNCNSAYQRNRYKNPEIRAKQLRANKEWARNNPERRRMHERKYFDAHPENDKARARVRYLVRRGVWKVQPCAVCGSEVMVEAHHDSYAQPHWETVRWLCKKHHESWHQTIDPVKKEVLGKSLTEVAKLRNDALHLQQQMADLRKQFRDKLSEADAIELSAWNRVVEAVNPLFKEFLSAA